MEYLIPREPVGLTKYQKCLIRSKNSEIFADYYLLLEKCIKYQLGLKQTQMNKMYEERKEINKLLEAQAEELKELRKKTSNK